MFACADLKQRHALGFSTRNADVGHAATDHLALIRHQHDLIVIFDGEGIGHFAGFFGHFHGRNPHAATTCAAVFIGGGPFAKALIRNGQDKLFLGLHGGKAFRGQAQVIGIGQFLPCPLGLFDAVGFPLFHSKVTAFQKGKRNHTVRIRQTHAPHAAGIAAFEDA